MVRDGPDAQPIVPNEKAAARIRIANQFQRRLGTIKKHSKASSAPPALGQKRFSIRFSDVIGPVVVAVSVDVSAAEPLIVTEVGFKLHVGASFPSISAVVTVHVKFTVPLNPFIPTTLMVPVFPVVAPGITVIEVVPPGPAVKVGSGVMLRAMLAVSISEPDVPVMVTITGLVVTAAERLALKVST